MKKKKTIAILLASILLAVIGFVVWKMEWFYSTPGSVFRRSLASANGGNYEAATRNLIPAVRDSFLADSAKMQKRWDAVTKKGSIRTIDNVLEWRKENEIQFKITYQDGTATTGRAYISQVNGRWAHGFPVLADDEVPVSPKVKTGVTWEITLPKEHARVKDTGLALRIPDGWSPDQNGTMYTHPSGPFFVVVTPTFADAHEIIEGYWKAPENSLSERRDISKDGVKMLFFEGTCKNSDGIQHRIHLIVWNGPKPSVITGQFPNQVNLFATARECITSVRISNREEK